MTDERTRGMRVTVTEDGPYVVSGNVPLIRAEIVVNDAGESVGWREVERIPTDFRYSLCRCGRSKTKPFCDFSHAEGFEGEETAEVPQGGTFNFYISEPAFIDPYNLQESEGVQVGQAFGIAMRLA